VSGFTQLGIFDQLGPSRPVVTFEEWLENPLSLRFIN
jgi:hypothetical protein